MKDAIKKIMHGSLFGIRIYIIFGAFYYFVTQQMTSQAIKQLSSSTDDIAITKHRKVMRDKKLVFLGEVKNNGDVNARAIKINVDLFLNDEFVKKCSKSLGGKLTPNALMNFELVCGGGCKSSPVVEHDSYKAYVTGF